MCFQFFMWFYGIGYHAEDVYFSRAIPLLNMSYDRRTSDTEEGFHETLLPADRLMTALVLQMRYKKLLSEELLAR